MKYTRTAKSISFTTRIDHVRIESVKSGYKIYADGDDREAIYFLGEHQTTAVAEVLGMQAEANFLDLVENDQIDRYLIGGEQPGEVEKE